MKSFLTILCLTLFTFGFAQSVSDFEDFNLDPESFLNGSDGSGGFTNGNLFFPNAYSQDYNFWTGWAISNTTDITTAGFMNQYSAITGGGYDGSDNYAVTFAFSPSQMKVISQNPEGTGVTGLYVTNSTYAYLSMRDGGAPAKQFGGPTGDDPDFFLLTIKKYLDGELSTDSINFYLADYRFEDNSMDYIIDEWTYINLNNFGKIDSLSFSLSSSDNDVMFGMNTPAYFCVDNIDAPDILISTDDLEESIDISIFPNPANDVVFVKKSNFKPAQISIYNLFGQNVLQSNFLESTKSLNIENLVPGTYIMEVRQGEKTTIEKLVKQ